MSLKSRLDTFGNIGIKPSYMPWEIYLTRKLNFLTLFSIFNVIFGGALLFTFGFTQFVPECIITLILAPFVIILNKKANYIWAAYLFYFIGFQLFTQLTLKMGLDSLSVLLYFPILISLIQMLGRRELLPHLFANLGMLLLSIIIILIGIQYSWCFLNLNSEALSIIKSINILTSFTCGIALITIITIESNKQELRIKSMLHDKEVLLAEVFHRVKNNMNIVTSLLNLKKHASESEEVKNALEECRNRVFSMALVHQKIYTGKNFNEIDFKEYIHDLVSESIFSHGGAKSTELNIDAEEVKLQLQNAIPCGLILNELITNAFKHAQKENQKLKIDIFLSSKPGRIIELIVKDNGPGIKETGYTNSNSLGIELIKSLTDQLDGDCFFTNNNGLSFTLRFKQ